MKKPPKLSETIRKMKANHENYLMVNIQTKVIKKKRKLKKNENREKAGKINLKTKKAKMLMKKLKHNI